MKKGLFLLVALLMISLVVLCACEDKKQEDNKSGEAISNVEVESGEENIENNTEEVATFDPADLEKLVMELNGASFKMDDRFEDVKEKLGAEARPSQTYTPCGGNDAEQVTTHYYDGYELEETHDGIIYHGKISGSDYPESKATLAGIKLGDTPDTVRNTFKTTPDVDSEYVINYIFGNIYVSFSLDFEGNGTVNYISIDDSNYAGV
ncbi:MAG: hypothetical protein IKI57_06990 [Clostridia bacterium]|nr:hypothetical protein [Clostridia bacterium]